MTPTIKASIQAQLTEDNWYKMYQRLKKISAAVRGNTIHARDSGILHAELSQL